MVKTVIIIIHIICMLYHYFFDNFDYFSILKNIITEVNELGLLVI